MDAVHRYTQWGIIALLLVGAGCDTADFEAPSKQPVADSTSFVNSIGLRFARIPAGHFQMGSAEGQENERPVREVAINDAFYMSVHEVTQRQWEMLMDENPSRFPDPFHPVEQVSWEDVQRFLETLNEREEGARYRLPTEAEWEYAARAGSRTSYHFGDDRDELGEYAWFIQNAGGHTYPIKRKKPNAFGLHDMHGNVWEWTQDYYHPTYYRWGASADPQGPDQGRGYVIRGGGWADGAVDLRAANRGWAPPDFTKEVLGFRLVREID